MLVRGENLTIDDLYAVAVGGAKVELDENQLAIVDDTCERIQRWGAEGHPIYGVTTGFGEMVYMRIPPRFETELQENLLRSHAAGGGHLFPDNVVRAIQVARINCLTKGYSGVASETLRLMADMVNREIHPVVPQQGSLGASGDLAPLSHLALPLIGEGRVRYKGEIRSSAEVLAEAGLRTVRLGYKDGLALINGTSAMTGVASLALVRGERLLRLALWASATFVQVMRGSTRAFEERGHQLKNHQGQTAVARVIYDLLDGGKLTREHADVMRLISEAVGVSGEVTEVSDYLQNAYTLRPADPRARSRLSGLLSSHSRGGAQLMQRQPADFRLTGDDFSRWQLPRAIRSDGMRLLEHRTNRDRSPCRKAAEPHSGSASEQGISRLPCVRRRRTVFWVARISVSRDEYRFGESRSRRPGVGQVNPVKWAKSGCRQHGSYCCPQIAPACR
jgi:hypothetical protein